MSNLVHKLYEYQAPNRETLVFEDRGPDGKLGMRGIFIQAELRNENQRFYPMTEISNAVNAINEKLQTGESVLGELDHPEELTINLDRVSHMINEMWMDGNNGCGKLVILESLPMGQIAKGLLESGVKLGVSSRGSGNVSHDGQVSDFEIITVDLVAQPSAPEAYPQSIYESLHNMRGGAVVHRIAHEAAEGDQLATKHLPQEILKFIKDLKL